MNLLESNEIWLLRDVCVFEINGLEVFMYIKVANLVINQMVMLKQYIDSISSNEYESLLKKRKETYTYSSTACLL